MEHFKYASVLFNCSMNSVQDQRVRKATKTTQPRLPSHLCLCHCLCLRRGYSVLCARVGYVSKNEYSGREQGGDEQQRRSLTKRNRQQQQQQQLVLQNNNTYTRTHTHTRTHTAQSKFKIKTKNSRCAGCTIMCERQRESERELLA